MSGSTTMYALKPIITRDSSLELSSCMYEMKNIHGVSRNSGDHACKESNNVPDISEQSPLPEVAVLEARQEKILAQLAELKEQVLSLCDVLRVTGQEPSPKCAALPEPVSFDLVINVNPLKPCPAVQALHNLWKDVNFRVAAHRHSNVIVAEPKIDFREKTSFRDTVNLTWIWKTVEDLEVVASGIHPYPIRGEINLLRYIARHLPSKNYEKSLSPRDLSTLDSVLDLVHNLHHLSLPKDAQATLAIIGKKLGSRDWFSGSSVGICDVAVWSAVKQSSVSKVPSSLSSWFARCEKQFLN